MIEREVLNGREAERKVIPGITGYMQRKMIPEITGYIQKKVIPGIAGYMQGDGKEDEERGRVRVPLLRLGSGCGD